MDTERRDIIIGESGIGMSPEAMEEARQKRRFIVVLRIAALLLMAVVAALGILRLSETANAVGTVDWWWTGALALAAIVFFGAIVMIDVLTPRRKLSAISAILLGTFAGVLATALIGFVIDLLVATYLPSNEASAITPLVLMFKVVIGIGLCYLGITTVLQTQDDFRLVIPYVEFSKRFRGPKPMLVDTSALIDGRITGLAESGLLQTPMVIPSYVLLELQTLADSQDKLKRSRGRRGLDVVRTLQRKTEVVIEQGRVVGGSVDQSLIDLASTLPATIITTDSGLVSVAQIEGVATVNLNELGQRMKTNVLPGSEIEIELVRRGEQAGQGVGFLDDGTMVVVERGEALIGERIVVSVRSSMQTAAGKLVFGRIAGSEDEDIEDESIDHTEQQDADSGWEEPEGDVSERLASRATSQERATDRPAGPRDAGGTGRDRDGKTPARRNPRRA
ncbi:MAG: PIN/TRAM domain-containing protein [Planctomycetota bacterium]